MILNSPDSKRHIQNNLIVLNDYVAILPFGPFRKTFLEFFELSASGQGNTRYCNISLCDEMFTLTKYFVIVIIQPFSPDLELLQAFTFNSLVFQDLEVDLTSCSGQKKSFYSPEYSNISNICIFCLYNIEQVNKVWTAEVTLGSQSGKQTSADWALQTLF